MKLSHFEQPVWHGLRLTRIKPQLCQQLAQLKPVVEPIAVFRQIPW